MKFSYYILAATLIAVCAPSVRGATGFVNHTFSVGDNLFANPLEASPDNTLDTIFSPFSTPDGTSISLWNSTTNSFDTTSTFSSGAWSIDLTLDPGTGARLTAPSNFINAFVGTVLTHDGTVWDGSSPFTPPPVFSGPDGLYLLGDKAPLNSTGSNIFLNILGRVPNVGEQVITSSSTSTYLGGGTWDVNPSLTVSDAVFLNVGPVIVPEPSSWLLAAVGCGLLPLLRSRRRKN